MEDVVVKRKDEVTGEDVWDFNPEWRQSWKEYVVIDDYIVFDSYDTQEEAQKIAELIRIAKKVVDDIRDFADSILDELTEEEINFLRKYKGGTIEIEI